jgi:hypothetical protein
MTDKPSTTNAMHALMALQEKVNDYTREHEDELGTGMVTRHVMTTIIVLIEDIENRIDALSLPTEPNDDTFENLTDLIPLKDTDNVQDE